MRRASQRRSRPAAAPATVITVKAVWRAGDAVRWRDREGTYLRDIGDGLSDITIGTRTYRVAPGELRPA